MSEYDKFIFEIEALVKNLSEEHFALSMPELAFVTKPVKLIENRLNDTLVELRRGDDKILIDRARRNLTLWAKQIRREFHKAKQDTTDARRRGQAV